MTKAAGVLFVAPRRRDERSSRVLLLKRSSTVPDAGLWNLPGGGVEPDESSWAAARREALEESGIDAANGFPLAALETCADVAKLGCPSRRACYAIFVVGLPSEEAPRLNGESSRAMWIPLADALRLTNLHGPLRDAAMRLRVLARLTRGP